MAYAAALDRYRDGNSPVHDLDPRVKVMVTLAFILSNALLPDGAWSAFASAFLLVMAVSVLAGLGIWFAPVRSLVALPFVLVAVTVVFSRAGNPIGSWEVGPWTLTATDSGLIRFASILARSWLSVQMAILLTATTRFPDLMHALHHLKVPRLLVATISFMVRYLYVIVDEAQRLIRARQSRSARRESTEGTPGRVGGTLAWRAKVTGSMVGQLFLRSYERSERVYSAMLARGYRGEILTMRPHALQRLDLVALFVTVSAIGAVHAAGRLGGVR